MIGLGHWGPNYARIISSIDGVELVALADREEKQLHAVGRQYPSVLPYLDYRTMLSHGGVDAVVVATPPTTHRQIVEDCVSAGVDVLVEKPLAASVEDAEDIVAAAEETQRILMVAHTFLFNPAVRRVKHYLEDGYLGRILYFSFIRTGLGPIRKDVNALWDLAPHDLSMIRYWTGEEEPVEVVARGQSYLRRGIDDIVFAILRYPNDILAGIHVSWLDPVKDRRVTIVGDQKMVVFDDVNVLEKLRIYDKGANYQPRGGDFSDFVAAVRDGDILIPKIENQEPLREQLVHFFECVRTRRRPICDGRDGLAVVRLLDRLQASLASTETRAALS